MVKLAFKHFWGSVRWTTTPSVKRTTWGVVITKSKVYKRPRNRNHKYVVPKGCINEKRKDDKYVASNFKQSAVSIKSIHGDMMTQAVFTQFDSLA